MGRQLLRLGLTLPLLTGIVMVMFPLVPVLERTDTVRTQMRRVDHKRRADFAAGQYEGGLVLQGDEDSPALTLASAAEGTYTSPVIELPLAASSLAAHWVQSPASGGKLSFAVRSSPEATTWGEWQELEGEGTYNTAGGLEVYYSTLAAANGARYAQYRVTLAADGSEPPALHAVGLFAFDSASAPPGSELHLRLAPRDEAQAAIKPLGIVSRKQWGADERLRFEASGGPQRGLIWPEEVTSVEKIVVHHTAGPNVCSSPEAYCQRRSVIAINDIYYYHTVVNGWGDIGYNSLVGYDGRIYEGRHGPEPDYGNEPLDRAVVAGHALGYNQRTHGIALMGDFQQESVPDLEYNALEKMVGWIVKSKLAAGGAIDPLGFSGYRLSNGQTSPAVPNIVGHRDLNDTECPGEYLYQKLADLRERAKRMTEWPPLQVELRAQPKGDTVSYHIFVDNHEPELVRRMIIKGAVPANTEFVDSWAGSPGSNRGAFDGSVVTWIDPDAKLTPGRDRREYVFVVRPRPGVSRAEVKTTAWVEFAEPVRGVAMSDAVSANQPVEAIAAPKVGGRESWKGDWPVSRNVSDYYGDAYQVHPAGSGSASYTWEVNLYEPGSYEVFAWWTAAPDRAMDAPFVVHARDGAHPVRVSQQERGARWVSLGTYSFDAGPARVSLSDDANGVVIADAVRFQKRP
ncbi:MAG: N-acetylmuramoyl-L-alanine amidase [Bacteroidetes bacterium]|nr:N-acetylmuramoyl-L-alanine amidase [Bacteroidota bacterium]